MLTTFPVALSIEGVGLSVTPRNFMFELTQHKVVKSTSGSAATVTSSLIQLQPCTSSAWSAYGSDLETQFSVFGMTRMLCLPSSTNIELAGYQGSDYVAYLTFKIMICNQTLDASCDTTSNIASYM